MITFEHVSKTYANGVKGLDQVDVTIGDGEFVAVIGLSGAGKSTFLRAINRLHDITEGDIRINGVSVTGAGKKQLRVIRRHIGMISQTFNLVKRSTVQKNVLSGRLGYYPTWKSILGIFSKEDYRLASEALARTLVQQADIILADEPVASLDPVTTRKILEDLRQINRNMKKTVIINIHSVELAKEFAGRILGFQGGRVIFDGTPEELTPEELKRIYGKDIGKEKEGAGDEA